MSPDPRKPISLPKGTASGASPKPPEASPVGDGLKKTSGEEKKGKALVAYLSNALMLVFVGVALISFYLVAKELISIQRLTGEKESIRKQIAEGRQSLSNLVGEISRFDVEARRAEANATDLTEREGVIANEVKQRESKLKEVITRKDETEKIINEGRQKAYKTLEQNAFYEERLKHFRKDINASGSEKNRLNKEIRSLKAELTATKSELQQLEPQKIELAEVEEKIKKLQGMVGEVREKEATLSGLQTQSDLLEKRLQSLNNELAGGTQRKEILDEEISSKLSKLKSEKEKESGIKESINRGNKQIEDKQKEIFTLNARVQDLNAKKASLEIENPALVNQIDSLRTKLQTLSNEKARLEQGIEDLEEKKSALGNIPTLLEQAESNAEKARLEGIKATEEATTATATRDRMIRENAGLETERQRLEGLKKKLLAEIGSLESKKKDLETPSPTQ